MIFLKFILHIIKFIFREFFSFVFKLALFIILIIVLITSLDSDFKKKELAKNSFLEINLNQEFFDDFILSPIPFEEDPTNFYQLLSKIKQAKTDEKISGILLSLDNNTLSQTQIYELGSALRDFNLSKKPIYSFGTIIDNKSLLLSSYSSNFFMPPSYATRVDVTGFNSSFFYFKNFADKIGVEVDVIHIGDFKSFGENYYKDSMSKEFKSDITRILKENYNIFSSQVSYNLNINSNNFDSLILDGNLMGASAFDLYNNNFITEMLYLQEVKNKFDIKEIVTVNDYELIEKKSNNSLAVIYATGEIHDDGAKGLDIITPSNLIKKLKVAEDDETIKGIVLRINSPGGSALASDIIYNYIRSIEKPIYISIGDIAASGGYYIASAGDKIFANNSSLTGSIGVVSLIPNFEKLSKKVGVTTENISLGKLANLYSLNSPMTPERKEKIFDSNKKVYDEFLSRVSAGRDMELSDLKKIAEGKIWLGSEALKNGLIDEVGGINEALISLGNSISPQVSFLTVEIPTVNSFNGIFSQFFQEFPMMKLFSKFDFYTNFSTNYDSFMFRPITYFTYLVEI